MKLVNMHTKQSTEQMLLGNSANNYLEADQTMNTSAEFVYRDEIEETKNSIVAKQVDIKSPKGSHNPKANRIRITK